MVEIAQIFALTALPASGGTGAAVDVGQFYGHGQLHLPFSAPSVISVWNFSLEHSDDGVTSWEVAAALSRITAADVSDTHVHFIDTDRLRRWVRLTWSASGAPTTIMAAAYLVGRRQYSGGNLLVP